LDARARLVYMHAAPHGPLTGLSDTLTSPSLRRIAHAGEEAALTVDRSLVDAVALQSAQVRALKQKAAAFREQLRGQAAAVLAAQDRARALLATAEQLAAQQRAAEELARLEA